MRMLEKIEDRLNPIFVLEMRQMARQKKFLGLQIVYAFALAYFCYVAIPSNFTSLVSRKAEAKEIMQSLSWFSVIVNGILVPILLSDHFIKTGSKKQLYLIFTSPLEPILIARGKLYVGLSVLATSTLMTFPIWCLLSFGSLISLAKVIVYMTSIFCLSLLPLSLVLLISSFGFTEFVKKAFVLGTFLLGLIFLPIFVEILPMSINSIVGCCLVNVIVVAIVFVMYNMSETEPSRLR